ncbi:MAG: sulfotransferase [Myxococcota bacterium]
MTARLPDPDRLLESAIAATGLADFGSPSFREGLSRLVDSLNAEADLNPFGRAMAEGQIATALANRLRIEAHYKDHPELESERIESPLFIVGMSRSGTTALSHLLGRDPNLRSLLGWEANDSVPPPETATYETDPRFLAAKARDAFAEQAMPGFRALHYDPPDAPMECALLFNHEFNSSALWTTFSIPSYMAWTLEADPTPAYAWHARMLKLLQSRKPGRWSLKAPQHATTLEALRARYPDAKLILTHRDPTVCAASTMSLTAFLQGKTSGGAQPRESARRVADFIERCCNGLLEFARRHGDDALIHVPYPELVANPLAVVEQIAVATDHELTPAARAALERHVLERPQHRHGVHRYAPEDFGFRREELDERYAAYRAHFGVALERK